jgi:hypothetical protein
MKLVTILFSLFLVACSTTGDSASNEVAIHEADVVTCRKHTNTGSRIATKVCKTNRSWTALARAAQDSINETTRRAAQTQTYNEQN